MHSLRHRMRPRVWNSDCLAAARIRIHQVTTPMLKEIRDTNGAASLLKQSLDVSTRRSREIAHRVANVSTFNLPDPANAQDAAAAQAAAVDVETEMVALADEQLRFEAATRLLQKVYAQLRTSVRGS
jgi:flagellar basal body rod protein FlgB